MATTASQILPLQEQPALGGDEVPSDEWGRTTAPLQAEGSGHHDLLLQTILPEQLASRVYPHIVSRTAGAIAILSLAIGTVVPVLALYVRSMPIRWTWVCLLATVAGLRRAALLDLRVLKLLLRQFETWYLLGNLLVVYWCSLSGLFAPPAQLLCLVQLLSGTSIIFFDAIRMHRKMICATAAAYSGAMFCAAVLLNIQASTWATDYNKKLFGNLSASSVFEGRVLTLSLFFCRYAVKLLYQPDAYTLLTTPLLADQGWQTSHGKPPGNVSPRPSLSLSTDMAPTPRADNTQGVSTPGRAPHNLEDPPTGADSLPPIQPNTDGLLLQWLSPRLAKRLYPILWHNRCEAFVRLLWVVGVLNMFYIFSVAECGVPLYIAVPSLLMHAPNVYLIAFLHLRTARRLLRRFELWFLLVNVALAPLCILRGLYAHQSSAVAGVSFITSCYAVPLLDALRVPPPIKLRHTALYAFFLLLVTALDRFVPSAGINYERVLLGQVTIASFFGGRMLTLGIFCLRYTYNLWLRPDICVMLSRPLMRKEKQHMFLSTLRTIAGGIRLESEGSLKKLKLTMGSSSEFKAWASEGGAGAC